MTYVAVDKERSVAVMARRSPSALRQRRRRHEADELEIGRARAHRPERFGERSEDQLAGAEWPAATHRLRNNHTDRVFNHAGLLVLSSRGLSNAGPAVDPGRRQKTDVT